MIHIAIVTGTSPASRRPLREQRAHADIAEARARAACGAGALASRSHSRGLSGCAAGSEVSALGLDIEYSDPSRRWAEIIRMHRDAPPVDALPIGRLCRAWTFLEAWWKAFGSWPSAEIIDGVLDPGDADEAVTAAGDAWRLHRPLTDGFHATIVWHGAASVPVWHVA